MISVLDEVTSGLNLYIFFLQNLKLLLSSTKKEFKGMQTQLQSDLEQLGMLLQK